MNQIGQHYLEDALRTFRDYKKLGERAFAQLSDEDFFRTIDDESNSIAVHHQAYCRQHAFALDRFPDD